MTLYIDSTDFNKVTYALIPGQKGQKVFKQIFKVDPHHSHEVLVKLEKFLKMAKIKNPQTEIHQIIVNKGPGSYTGTRVGVTHALALGMGWGVPVKAVEGEFVVGS